jgi:ribosome modulation factor
MVPFDAPTQFEDQAPEQHLTPRREALDGWRNPVELTG